MDKKYCLMDDDYKQIGIKELQRRYNLLKNHREEFCYKIKIIEEEKYNDKIENQQQELQPEEKIYTLKI